MCLLTSSCLSSLRLSDSKLHTLFGTLPNTPQVAIFWISPKSLSLWLCTIVVKSVKSLTCESHAIQQQYPLSICQPQTRRTACHP